MKAILQRAAIPATALVLIGVGAGYMFGWPAGLIVVGGLLWVDMVIWSIRR